MHGSFQEKLVEQEAATASCKAVVSSTLLCATSERQLTHLMRRSFQEKAAAMQKEAARLSREKAPSTNRKAKQTMIKHADAMKASVEALAARGGG